MAHFPFLLAALGVLSSVVPHSIGFSTSRLISSNAVKNGLLRRMYFHGSLVLHVAPDQTTIIDEVDFISVEEAEEALQEERARYEGERSELEWLLEFQRQQLRELVDGRQEKQSVDDTSERKRERRSSHDTKCSSRIVILGTHAKMKSSGKKRRRKINSRNFRNISNQKDRKNENDNDGTFFKMKQLENLLQEATVDNEALIRRLYQQRHQYNIDRSMFEDELREGHNRLNCVRDELHMERAYFQTSRRMLEQQQKVQELEKELMMLMISRGELLSHQEQSQFESNEVQCQGHVQEEYIRRDHSRNENNDARSYQQGKRRDTILAGFTMNINDVQFPLYP
jgi:hypothetical protein